MSTRNTDAIPLLSLIGIMLATGTLKDERCGNSANLCNTCTYSKIPVWNKNELSKFCLNTITSSDAFCSY